MNSLLKMKRLPGILALALVTLAVGAAGVPASASTGTDSGAQVSGLSKKQKKSQKKALKKCNKKKAKNKKATKKKRSKCKKHVKKKYKKLAKKAAPAGETTTVLLGDSFFSPGLVDIKVNDSVLWSWQNVGGYEPHNVVLSTGPSGVKRNDYDSGQPVVDKNARFKRTFIKPGTYNFVCAIHANMTMTVNVSK